MDQGKVPNPSPGLGAGWMKQPARRYFTVRVSRADCEFIGRLGAMYEPAGPEDRRLAWYADLIEAVLRLEPKEARMIAWLVCR